MLDEDAVLEKIRSIGGAVAAFDMDADTFRMVHRLESDVSASTAGLPMDNRALEACIRCSKHVAIFCDDDLDLPEGHIISMEDPEGNVVGFDVSAGMRERYAADPGLVWLSEDFAIRSDADIGGCRMVMLPKEVDVIGVADGVARAVVLFPNVDTDAYLKRRYGFPLDDPRMATAILAYEPL